MFNFQLSTIAKACGLTGPFRNPNRSDIGRKWCRAFRWLKVVVMPEATDSAPFANRDSFNEACWIGVVKTLFWVAASIAIGLLLAVCCT